jgi:cell division septation protein DedD
MKQYLQAILQETNTVIIPNLGALTLTGNASDEIMFMSYLKYDDGKLVKFISSTDGISEEEAKEKINQFVDEVEAGLEANRKVELPNFGLFFKNSEGEIEFAVGSHTESEPTTASVAEEMQVQPATPAPVVEKVVVEEKKEEKQEAAPVATDKTPASATSPAKPTKEEVKQKELAAKKAKEEAAKKAKLEKETAAKAAKEAKEAKKLKANAPLPEGQTAPKKRRGFFFYFFLLLFVGGIGTVVFLAMKTTYLDGAIHYVKNVTGLDSHEATDSIPGKEQMEGDSTSIDGTTSETTSETETPVIEHEQTDPAEESVTEKPIVEKPVVEQHAAPSTNATGGGFFVIAGAFTEVSNAENYHQKLKSQGNDASMLGQYSGLYLVSIASYSSRGEAESGLAKAKETSPNAWVFRKK